MQFIYKINDSRVFHHFTNFMIIICTVLIAIEVSVPDGSFLHLFNIFDYFVIIYFTAEIILRSFVVNRNRNTPQYKSDLFWFIFDGLIVGFSFIALSSHLLNHPEAISILRLFRIFRIFRLFEISNKVRQIEKKIFAVIPTVLTFAFLLLIIILIYAILGMHMFQKQEFTTLSFTNLYQAIKSLFIFITNDYSAFITEVGEKCGYLSEFIIDLYFISFYIISSMIMLNVFVAVMTNNIQDELKREIMEAEIKDEDQNIILNTKIDALMVEIQELKQKLK